MDATQVRRFAVEGYRFLHDVHDFKVAAQRMGTPAASWVKTNVKLLVKTYLSKGAPMELNISDRLVEDVQQKLTRSEEGNQWRVDTLDRVEAEVSAMVLFDLWHPFVLSGELDDVRQLAAKSSGSARRGEMA